jgi:hypothetical protein
MCFMLKEQHVGVSGHHFRKREQFEVATVCLWGLAATEATKGVEGKQYPDRM